MKRNHNRADKKSSRHSTESQSKKELANLEKARRPGGAGEEPAAVAATRHSRRPGRAGMGGLVFILQSPDGRELERVEFNPLERRGIESAAKAAGLALPGFFLKTLRNAVDPVEMESGFITGGIVVKLADEAGNYVGSVKIDGTDAELLQKAAAASELKLTELLHFIVLRQLEAFFPPEVEGLYRVSDNAIHEISSGFESAQQHVETLWAVALALVERVGKERSLVSPADYCAAISELKVLSSLIKDLAGSARVDVADANMHWQIAGRPALLEQHVAPVSIPSARVAA